MGGGRLRIICGPTAAGKSQLALNLAERVGASIVSADSRQIYVGFDIGTAKPTSDDRARIPHYGIDVVDPRVRYSAARWVSDADTWIARAIDSGRHPLIVGGTGLYIRALVQSLFRAPELDATRRAHLAEEIGPLPIAELRRWCAELDPPRAHLGRTQLLRAIETALLAGERISDMHAAYTESPESRARSREAVYLLVDPGAALAARIENRVDRMMESGWRKEVRDLSSTVAADAPAWKASGYSVMRSLVAGEIELSTARERVIIETRQYAKRQRTWFRHQLPVGAVTHVNPDDPAAAGIVHDWWESAE